MVSTRSKGRDLPPLPRRKDKEIAKDVSGDSSIRAACTNTSGATSKTTATPPPSTSRFAEQIQSLSSRKDQGTQQQQTVSSAKVAVDDATRVKVTAATVTRIHFLDGIQLEHLDNVLSIPDPPSPHRSDGHYSRRFSTSAMDSVRPLRNISNASSVDEEGADGMIRNNNVTRRLGKGRSKRTTMMPQSQLSPFVNPEGVDKPSTACTTPILPIATVAKPHKHEKRPQPLPQLASISKRRKKRQSLALCSHVEVRDLKSDEVIQAYATFKNDPTSATPPLETLTPIKPPILALHDLRKLVHDYTAIPRSERSSDCSQAQEILTRTGYPLSSFIPATSHARVSEIAEPSMEQKMKFFCRIGPQLKQMDACKTSDAKMAQEVTQCRPQKIRGGFYRYFHEESGRAVSPEEFEERYLMMLEEVNRIRSATWLQYFDALRKNKLSKSENRAEELHRSRMESLAATPALMHHKTEESSKASCGYLPHELVSMQHQLSSRSELLLSTTARQGESSFSHEETKPIHDKPALLDGGVNADSSAKRNLVSFPDRDEESSDPVIAQAERKLWDAIDKALAEYSREVLAAPRRANTLSASATVPTAAVGQQTPVHC